MTTIHAESTSRRVVLLTGVGKPGQVGEAVALAFAQAGDHVLLVDLRPDDSRARAADVVAAGGQATPYGADLTDPADVDRLVARISRDHGARLDAVVHMAGGWTPGSPIATTDPAQWDRTIAINLTTSVHTARAFTPLVRSGRGAFVFFASEAALPGARVAGMAAYAVAKRGVVTLMTALAQEERPHGVRANALAPAAIRTASNEAGMGVDTPYVEREDVAAAVLWLCSPAASAVSGEVIRLAPAPRAPGGA